LTSGGGGVCISLVFRNELEIKNRAKVLKNILWYSGSGSGCGGGGSSVGGGGGG
jgi:hypothetical protein